MAVKSPLTSWLGTRALNRTAMWLFIAYFLGPIFLAGADTGLLWLVTDTMTIIGVCAAIACLVALRKVVVELHNDFWHRYLPALEKGENPARVSFVSKP
jgi:alanine or glycine:cation symporter, AGCS family